VTVFELARVMGTSVAMIERSYGTLIEGAGADIARRLGAFEAAQDDDNRQQERRQSRWTLSTTQSSGCPTRAAKAIGSL
jgi:hypothetical protein